MTEQNIIPPDLMKKFSGGNFEFHGTSTKHLKSTKYTLGIVAIDVSGSLYGFGSELTEMGRNVIEALRKDKANAPNMLIRGVTFASTLNELHGFKLLKHIDEQNEYPIFKPNGGTALIDVTYSSIEAIFEYARNLTDQEYTVNAILAVVTDGDDTTSSRKEPELIELLHQGARDEEIGLESFTRILIGMNTKDCGAYLNDFKTVGEFDQYFDMDDASPSSIAKIGLGISSAISSTSSVCGTGQASAPIII